MKKATAIISVIVLLTAGLFVFRRFGLDYKMFYALHKEDFQRVGEYMLEQGSGADDSALADDLNASFKEISPWGKAPAVNCYKGSAVDFVFFDFDWTTAFAYYPDADISEVKSTAATIHDDYKTVSQMSDGWYYVTKIGG